MKHHARFSSYLWAALISILTVVPSSLVPLLGAQAPSQGPRLQQELEVMKSILSTTLSFLGRSEQPAALIGSTRGIGIGRIDALYLRGQGAVFTVSVRNAALTDAERFASLEKELQRLEASKDPGSAEAELKLLRSMTHEGFLDMAGLAEIAEAQALASLTGQGEETDVVAPTPHPRPMVVKKPAPGEIRKEIERLKQNLAESKRQAEENRQRIQSALVDVLSRYGDSLSQLPQDEYVNIVVSSNTDFGLPVLPSGIYGFNWDGEAGAGGDMILTTKISDIRDYRAGRIDLATLRSRIDTY